jgi:hypothetical protein
MKTKNIFVKRTAACFILFAFLLLSAIALCDKVEGSSGLIYGTDHAYWISSPSGWILDNESGVSQGLHAVIYPKGENWTDAPAVIYSRAVVKKKGESMGGVIKNDFDSFKKSNANIVMKNFAKIKTGDGSEAIVKSFKGDQWGNNELVAYIDTPKVVGIIVLTARNAESYNRSIEAFESVVRSFSFVTDKVKELN